MAPRPVVQIVVKNPTRDQGLPGFKLHAGQEELKINLTSSAHTGHVWSAAETLFGICDRDSDDKITLAELLDTINRYVAINHGCQGPSFSISRAICFVTAIRNSLSSLIYCRGPPVLVNPTRWQTPSLRYTALADPERC